MSGAPSSDAETIAHARAGHCVARAIPHHAELPELILGRVAVPLSRIAEQEEALRLAGRERGIDILLHGRIDAASRDCPGCGYPVPDFRKSCYVCGLEIGRAE
jgi:hypothetical protein